MQLVPHIRFTGPAGEKLSADLIGVSIPDFYQGYLEEAIDVSVARLKPDNK